ncbi:MAG: trypsin-like serine protease [Ketobacteraceae bacterium]|nr:trypsin-like serine protease [Ketobacteraceae bacterium]
MKFSWVVAVFLTFIPFLPVNASLDPSVTQPRIIGGEDVAEAPSWMAYLVIYNTETGMGGACGASLISSRWLVTAAHCVEEFGEPDYAAYVAMGAADLESGGVRTMLIDKVISHPDYTPNSDQGPPLNDVALIRLSSPVTDLAPIRIINSVDLAGLNDDYPAMIYGWGETGSGPSTVLQAADVSFRTQDTCDDAWSGFVSESSVCSIDEDSGTCFGDSGGPLTVTVDDEEVLVGITSYGAGGPDGVCRQSLPDVFMSPSYYFSWIAETVGFVSLDGGGSFGYIGVNQAARESLSLTNYSGRTVGIASLSVSGVDADNFALSDNQCIQNLLPGASCSFALTASSAAAGDAGAHLVLTRADGGENLSFGLSASFLPAIGADGPLQINGGSWFSNGNNPWSQSPALGSGSTPGFTSGFDDSASLLLLHVNGPLELLAEGISLETLLFDGVLVHLDNSPLRWYRLDDQETTLRVTIPEGAHRVLFTYEKANAEESRIGIYNFRTAALSISGSNESDNDSGGSSGLWLLVAVGLLTAARRGRQVH